MKTKLFSSFIFTVSVLISLAQTTNKSGNWEENIWTGGNPGLSVNNDVTVNTGHDVFLGTASTNKNLTLNGNKNTLTIKGNLVINGNLTVAGNNWEIIVLPGAYFKVTGNVLFNSKGKGAVIPDLEINGVVEIGGNLSGNGNVTGSGSLTVDGSIGAGIKINPKTNDSVNVIGNSSTYYPPISLTADVNFNVNYYSVLLKWEYNTSCGATGFEVKRILNGVTTNTIIGITKSTEFSWTDGSGDLTGESNPIYEVRAIYSNEIKSSAAIVSFENNPLPIELISFTAQQTGSAITINWATAAEINNDYFTIERSNDGRNWEVISYVTGAGNSNHVIRYEYADMLPMEGTSYYRLTQTDFDGKFEVFSPVAVFFGSEQAKSGVANVRGAANSIEVALISADSNATLLIADIQGRIIGQQTLPGFDYMQHVVVNTNRNINGEIVIVKLISENSSFEGKFMIR